MKKALSIFFTLLSLHVFSQQIIPCNDTISSFSHNTYEYYSKNPEQIFSVELDWHKPILNLVNKNIDVFKYDTIQLYVGYCGTIYNYEIYELNPSIDCNLNAKVNDEYFNFFQIWHSMGKDTVEIEQDGKMVVKILLVGLTSSYGTYTTKGDTVIFKVLNDDNLDNNHYEATIAKIKQNDKAVITKKYRLKLQGRILLLIAIKD
ncbi:MAG: hypothetical protein ABL940_06540 [Bacteroidia bacterium]